MVGGWRGGWDEWDEWDLWVDNGDEVCLAVEEIMKRLPAILMLLICLLLPSSAPAQTILGKNPYDKIVDSFFVPATNGTSVETNADTIIKGLNTYGTIPLNGSGSGTSYSFSTNFSVTGGTNVDVVSTPYAVTASVATNALNATNILHPFGGLDTSVTFGTATAPTYAPLRGGSAVGMTMTNGWTWLQPGTYTNWTVTLFSGFIYAGTNLYGNVLTCPSGVSASNCSFSGYSFMIAGPTTNGFPQPFFSTNSLTVGPPGIYAILQLSNNLGGVWPPAGSVMLDQASQVIR